MTESEGAARLEGAPKGAGFAEPSTGAVSDPVSFLPGVAERLGHYVYALRDPRDGRIWVCDITYVQTGQGFLFLAVVQDVFSRRIAGRPRTPPDPDTHSPSGGAAPL